jgi:hypothetical protein
MKKSETPFAKPTHVAMQPPSSGTLAVCSRQHRLRWQKASKSARAVSSSSKESSPVESVLTAMLLFDLAR